MCIRDRPNSMAGKELYNMAKELLKINTKEDTYHWKVCENDGCVVTTTKTKHSGTDDGDCTTPVICECGEIVTAAKSEHIYGEWKSNGNGKMCIRDRIYGFTEIFISVSIQSRIIYSHLK